MFETNIRHLGGLLAAYDLSREPALLAKAVELGDMLYVGFDTPSRIPPFWLNFEQANQGTLVAETHQISASVGAFSLEFTRLSQITGNAKYYSAIAHLTSVFVLHQNLTALPGKWPTFIDARNAKIEENSFTLGALADALYEYLPKMYYLLGGQEPIYEEMYMDAMEAIKQHLLFRPMLTDNGDILFSGSAAVNRGVVELNSERQHLACFAGGLVTVGGKLFSHPEHFDVGAKLTHGCAYAYIQEMAWKIFQSIQNATEAEYGNAGIDDVNAIGDVRRSEAKRFHGVSPPDLISLDDCVLNTEAHPLKRPK
ncbi:hypothetical protein LTS15_000929 [Exophiala xenobiotica]|nr:hypothetical protein LTS15_000929 [Exophiala xenobiotica]